jgi:hypothetical protein
MFTTEAQLTTASSIIICHRFSSYSKLSLPASLVHRCAPSLLAPHAARGRYQAAPVPRREPLRQRARTPYSLPSRSAHVRSLRRGATNIANRPERMGTESAFSRR